MRDADRKKANEAERAPSAGRAGALDPNAKALLARNGKLGNESVQQMLGQSAQVRDALLAFATGRLGTIRELQLQELEHTSLRDLEQWWRQTSDSHKEDWGGPEPVRWREAAGLYDDAIRALCDGHVERGAQLLDKAVAEEEKQREATKKPMDLGMTKGPSVPDERGSVRSGQACGVCDIPAEARRLSSEIERVTSHLREPPNRRRPRDPWWTVDEEAEEENKGGAEGDRGRAR
jgi:hypothetical protein